MRNTRLIAVIVSLTALATLAADASAYYHPTVGRFISRHLQSGGTGNRDGRGKASRANLVTRSYIPTMALLISGSLRTEATGLPFILAHLSRM